MPIYSYQCDQCHEQFEVRASFEEKERGIKPKCPNCRNEEVHQILGIGFSISGKSKHSGPMNNSCCGSNSMTGSC